MAGSKAIFTIDSTSRESLPATLLDSPSCPPEPQHTVTVSVHRLNTMHKVDIRRYYALFELIDTERAYLRDLKTLIHVGLFS